MDPYVLLATQSIKEYVQNRRILDVPPNLPKEMLSKKAGVFVSIHRIHKPTQNPPAGGTQKNTEGELRGCIGTFLPTKRNIALEIIDNAVSACSRDWRFSVITQAELPDLEINVDILSEPKLIINNYLNNNSSLISQLDAKRYGVIIRTSDGRTGLLLPDLEGVDTPLEQIDICRQKAGISKNEPISISRFEVERHKN